MGVTIHELRAVISGNLVGFSQMVDGAISKTQSLRKAWGDFANDAARATNRIVNTFGLIGGAVTGAAVKMGFSFNSIKEQSEIAFTTMLGDGQKAKKFIAELTEFAAKTPFELPGLLDSTKRLMAFGFEAEKIIPMLTVVGDAAAGLGNPAAMDFIIRALGQIQAKGKVAAQEMNQLAEQGIPAWQALADRIGVSIPEAMKLAEQGAISSGVAIPAILEGMDAKFRGLMEKQSGSMSGLLSTLMDRLRGWAGDAFLPIYDSIRNGMSKLLSGDSLGMIDNVVKRIRDSMFLVAVEIDSMFAADPSALFNSIGTAADHAARIFASFVGWLRQSGPAFMETARNVWGFLEPWLEYLREHPQILAALIALKITGMLGVTQAAVSLGAALLQTIMSFGRLGGATTTLGAGLKGLGFLTALSGAVALAYGVKQLTLAMTGYNAAVERSQELNKQMSNEFQRKNSEKLSAFQQMTDPAERRAAMLADLEKTKRSQLGAESLFHGATANADKLAADKGYFGDMFGTMKASARAEAKDLGTRLQEIKDYRAQLEKMLADEDRAIAAGESSISGSRSSVFKIPEGALDSIHGADDKKAAGKRADKAQSELEKFEAALDAMFGELPDEEIERMREDFTKLGQEFVSGNITSADFKMQIKSMSDVLNDANKVAEKAAAAQDQFNSMLEQFSGQVPDDELDAWHTAFGELRTAFEEGEINSAQFKRGIDVMNQAINDSAQMQDRFASLRESFGDQSVDGWVDTFESLQDELRSGEITAQVYKSEMAALNQEIQRSTQAESDRTQFLNQMGGLQQELAAKKIQMPDSFWNSFNDRFSALTQKFTTGAMSAQQFARATDALQREMDAAGNAAIKELQAKERARLLSGNFTQEEFQKAAEDRIIQMRMQQFDQYVEQAVNSMMGFNNGLQQMGGNLQQFGNNLQQFGNGFGGMQQQFDPEQLRAAQATYNAFANSVQGQMAGIINEIALAQERLSLSSIVYGDAIKGQERWATITWIEELSRQLERLQYAPPPQFVAGLGDFRFTDPGLQSGTQQPSAMTINVNVPNLTRMNNQEVENLVEAIRREQERRGRQIFGG